MLADLIRRLTGAPDSRPLPPDDCRLALAALMVRLARSDGGYERVEQLRIEQMLIELYKLPRAQAEALRLEAQRAEAAAADTVQFTRLVKEAVPYEDRVDVIEALWKVAGATEVGADERGFLRLVANLIGVTDQDSGLARQRVLGAE